MHLHTPAAAAGPAAAETAEEPAAAAGPAAAGSAAAGPAAVSVCIKESS